MAVCPKCNAEVLIDFGMGPCASCSSMLIVDIDGNATLADDSENKVESIISSDFAGAVESLAQVSEPAPVDSSSFEDVINFSNSSVSTAKDGRILFNVFITGVDTKDIRALVREALEDQRFLWQVDGLMSSIKDGALEMRNLNPVKASVLVNRLKHLPIEISWHQVSITEVEL